MTQIFTIPNVTPAIIQTWQTFIQQAQQKYSFSTEYNTALQTLIVRTSDTSVITFLTGKGFVGVTDTTISYDDTKTIFDVESAVLANNVTPIFRPELINLYKSTLSNLQNQAKNLGIIVTNQTISQLQTAIQAKQVV